MPITPEITVSLSVNPESEIGKRLIAESERTNESATYLSDHPLANIFPDKSSYLAMRARFRERFQRRDLTVTDFAFYALMRGKDWRSGLSSNTDEHLAERVYWRLAIGDPEQYLNLELLGVSRVQVLAARKVFRPERWEKLEKLEANPIDKLARAEREMALGRHTFVFVRHDLPAQQQTVQACHACLMREDAGNENLVLVGMKDAKALLDAREHLDRNSINYSLFVETADNLGYPPGPTSICTEPLEWERKKRLKRYQVKK